jgi:uncharacterized protein (DUF433 family)
MEATCVRGTRIGLDVLIWPLRRDETSADLLRAFPSIGAQRMKGIISFIEQHPEAIEQYLDDQARLWEEMTRQFPMPPDMLRRLAEARSREAQSREEKLSV